MIFHRSNKKKGIKKPDIEKIELYGRTKQEVMNLLSNYKYEYKNGVFCFLLRETWYGKRRIIRLVFENNKVEEKYIKTEYGKLSITQLYKNLSGYH